MTLPAELSNIFAQKQKSYKMVLILALLDEMKVSNQRAVSFTKVKERFLAFLQEKEKCGAPLDLPPTKLAPSWEQVTLAQVQSIIDSPVTALSHILKKNPANQTIGFKRELYKRWDQDVLIELYDYASKELKEYHGEGSLGFSVKDALHLIMSSYLKAKTEPFAGHSLGHFVRQTLPNQLRTLPFLNENLKVQGSVGQGNWANIPWLAIMDKRITETTQQGEYIVYLFSDDMQSVYLTLSQGVTIPLREKGKAEGYKYLQQKVLDMRQQLPLHSMMKDDHIHLTSAGLGYDYQVSTVAYYRYDRENLPGDEQLLANLQNLVENYGRYVDIALGIEHDQVEEEPLEVAIVDSLTPLERLTYIQQYIKSKGFAYPELLIENFYLSLKSKPFVILAGVSGTGKTKLVKLFAESIGATSDSGQFTLIPVRPDWSDPSDLIGYKDLSGTFRPGPLTQVLVEASKPTNRHKPFFVCLDEMNLARVEHYFSDMLSVLETQEWREDRIITLPVISKEILTTEDQEKYGELHIPDNLYIIGTVNMDETTHPFSKKVLDRANTIEFNYIDLNQYPDISGASDLNHASSSNVPNSFIRSEYLQLVDIYQEYKELVEQTTTTLVRMNNILEGIHSHVGFRIRDAICFYMIYNERFQLMDQDQAFDFQFLQKILPRIQGSSTAVKRTLLELMQVAVGRKLPLQELMEDASELYVSTKMMENAKYPLSARKLAFMIRRLEEDGFTSYWLS